MIALLLAAALAADPASAARVTVGLTLQAPEPKHVADLLVASTERRGGWYASRKPQEVVLRVPVEQVDALVEEATGLGRVVGRGLTKEDVTAALADLDARIASRREVLEMYEEVLDRATPSTVVTVEQQIVGAIGALEPLVGQRRKLLDEARFARVVVAFRYPDRTPTQPAESPFTWIRNLDIKGLVEGLAAPRPTWRTHVHAVAPDGFAAFPKERGFRAVSPDRVRFRVRETQHQPVADLAFWREAVRVRQVSAGYRLLAEEDLTKPVPGALIELGAARGPEDWTYLVALFPQGDRVVVVEAAGPADRVAARRAAIVAAMQAWTP